MRGNPGGGNPVGGESHWQKFHDGESCVLGSSFGGNPTGRGNSVWEESCRGEFSFGEIPWGGPHFLGLP